jgi:hypothetical protein
MARTLLDMTQDILSTLDSDPVNSISDTYESLQVATLIKTTYQDIVEEYGLPTNQKLSYLEGVGDLDRPTHLKIPDNVRGLHWWKYDKRLDIADALMYTKVNYYSPIEFIEYCNQRDSLDTTNYQTITLEANVKIIIGKTAHPYIWTSFDNEYVVCDAYNSDVDATLQQSKTQAFLEYGPTFTFADAFVPDLPENLSTLLFRTAENTCYALFKQTVNPKLEQKERRLRIRAQRNKTKVDEQQNNVRGRPDYGR